jgi:hypothetical protein
MARGWESKSIEIQIEEAGGEARNEPGQDSLATDPEERRQREDLLLRRARVLQELASARNQRYRQLLEETLRHLDIGLNALPGA